MPVARGVHGGPAGGAVPAAHRAGRDGQAGGDGRCVTRTGRSGPADRPAVLAGAAADPRRAPRGWCGRCTAPGPGTPCATPRPGRGPALRACPTAAAAVAPGAASVGPAQDLDRAASIIVRRRQGGQRLPTSPAPGAPAGRGGGVTERPVRVGEAAAASSGRARRAFRCHRSGHRRRPGLARPICAAPADGAARRIRPGARTWPQWGRGAFGAALGEVQTAVCCIS